MNYVDALSSVYIALDGSNTPTTGVLNLDGGVVIGGTGNFTFSSTGTFLSTARSTAPGHV